MTTLTPFRLFQICKYALQQYTSHSPLFQRGRRSAAEGAIRGQQQVVDGGQVGAAGENAKRGRKREVEGGLGDKFQVEPQEDGRSRGWDVKPGELGGAAGGAEVGGMKSGGFELRLPERERGQGGGSGRYRVEMGMGVGSEIGSSASSPSSSSSSSSTSSSNLRPTPNSTPSSSPPPPNPSPAYRTEIARLMAHPALFTPHFTPPKNVIVLCHGLYGFSTATPIPLFPSLKLHYWHSVLSVLRETLGCKVMVVGVKGTGSIEERAGEMDRWLKDKLPKGTGVNFVAHSMGGLDCRYLITHLKPTTYTPLSLTMIGTPNRGSPFMDWCAANIGVGVPSMTKAAIKAAASGKLPPYSLKSPLLSRTMGDVGTSKSPAQRQQEAREDAAAAAKESSSLLAFS